MAIPAAKKHCAAFASDVNPESYKWLLCNCKSDKVDQKVKVGWERFPARTSQRRVNTAAEAIVMNLTAKAIEFLTTFKAFLDGSHVTARSFPLCTVTALANPAKDVQQRTETVLGIS